MITKKCNDAFGYGCTLNVEVESEDGLLEHFYKKNTHTGTYFLNTCKNCVKKKHKEKYADGSYNWHMRHDKSKQYDEPQYTIGANNGDHSGE